MNGRKFDLTVRVDKVAIVRLVEKFFLPFFLWLKKWRTKFMVVTAKKPSTIFEKERLFKYGITMIKEENGKKTRKK